MVSDHLAMSRRNIHERKVLRLARGENPLTFFDEDDVGVGFHARKDKLSRAFEDLRKISSSHNFDIRLISSQYISNYELKILKWVAESQRCTGLRTCNVGDQNLKNAIVDCGTSLKSFGVFLPSQTLFVST